MPEPEISVNTDVGHSEDTKTPSAEPGSAVSPQAAAPSDDKGEHSCVSDIFSHLIIFVSEAEAAAEESKAPDPVSEEPEDAPEGVANASEIEDAPDISVTRLQDDEELETEMPKPKKVVLEEIPRPATPELEPAPALDGEVYEEKAVIPEDVSEEDSPKHDHVEDHVEHDNTDDHIIPGSSVNDGDGPVTDIHTAATEEFHDAASPSKEVEQPQETPDEENEEDRKKRIAERIAKMGGMNPFGAAPPFSRGPPKVPQRQVLRAEEDQEEHTSYSPPVDEVEAENDEEVSADVAEEYTAPAGADEGERDEEVARKRRIAEKMSKMGGRNPFVAVPSFQAPSPPPPRQASSHDSEPIQDDHPHVSRDVGKCLTLGLY